MTRKSTLKMHYTKDPGAPHLPTQFEELNISCHGEKSLGCTPVSL